MIGSQRTVSSADRVSGWLILAKQRALRDLRPNGVRFIGRQEVAGGPVIVGEAQYIETPELFVPNPNSVPERPQLAIVNETTPGSLPFLYYTAPAPNTAALKNELDQRVNAYDRLITTDLISVNYVLIARPDAAAVNLTIPGRPGTVPGYRLPVSDAVRLDLKQRLGATVSTNSTTPAILTYGFSFQGQPQPVLGEPVLQITNPMVIDVRITSDPAATTTTGVNLVADPFIAGQYNFDVVFKPSGPLLNGSGGVACLWLRNKDTLRDETGDPASNPRGFFDKAGQQLLVVISSRTGLISTQPVNDDAANPYRFATDGKNNGV